MVDTWPYWLGFGAALVLLLLLVVASFGVRDATRQWKFLCAAVVWGVSFAVYGVLAFGLTYYDRGDGYEVQWGRWALNTARMGALVAAVVLSYSREFVDAIVGFFLGSGAAAFLLAAVLSPIGNGGNAERAFILLLVLSCACTVGVLLQLLALTFQWRALMFFPRPDRSQGMVNVMSRWWYAGAAVALFAAMALYPLLCSLGPEGFRVYHKESTQIWLTLALADVLCFGIIFALIYYLLNPDGEPSDRSAWAVLSGGVPAFYQSTAQMAPPVDALLGAPLHASQLHL